MIVSAVLSIRLHVCRRGSVDGIQVLRAILDGFQIIHELTENFTHAVRLVDQYWLVVRDHRVDRVVDFIDRRLRQPLGEVVLCEEGQKKEGLLCNNRQCLLTGNITNTRHVMNF